MSDERQIQALAKALDRYVDWQQHRTARVEREQVKRYWTKQQRQGAAIRAEETLSELEAHAIGAQEVE